MQQDREEIIQIIRLKVILPGPEEFPVKYVGEDLWEEVYQDILDIRVYEKMPVEWRGTTIVPLHKKGNQLKCENSRGTKLLSTVYKIPSMAISWILL